MTFIILLIIAFMIGYGIVLMKENKDGKIQTNNPRRAR